MPAPTSILLLHGLGGSGEGSVKLLQARLDEAGWTDGAFLRPTLQAVNQVDRELPMDQRFVQALQELDRFLGGRIPHLTIGLSFGGLLAAYSPSKVRLSVCSPWDRLPAHAVQKALERPEGWSVLQGGRDLVVPADQALAALPGRIPRTLDPEGTHAFDDWMDRIAAWTTAKWQSS